MNDLFIRLGFSEKEAFCYHILLENGSLTASDVSKRISESRTNTYMILERLDKSGMVIIDDSLAVRRYGAADPSVLKQNLIVKQQELKRTQNLLVNYLPELNSLYNLERLKPGVVYLEGIKGLEVMLDDMARSNDEVLLIPGGPIKGEAWETLKNGIIKRANKGIKTRAIFQEDARELIDHKLHQKQKYEVRFWGKAENPGEVVVYGNKCVFTAYEPEIINTILTNDVIAQTLRSIFEGLWAQATL